MSFEYEPGHVFEALQQAEVDFVVIGGVALNLHGSALITSDTDVMYARDAENVGRLASALAQLDVRLRGGNVVTSRPPIMIVLTSGHHNLPDVLMPPNSIFFPKPYKERDVIAAFRQLAA